MGRTTEEITKEFKDGAGTVKTLKVKLFPWEELNYVDKVKEAFGI